MALPQPNPNSSDVQLKDVLGSFIEIAAQKTEFDQTQMALVGSKNPGGEKESVKGSIFKLDENLDKKFGVLSDNITGGKTLHDINETLSKIGIILTRGINLNDDLLQIQNRAVNQNKDLLQIEDKRLKRETKEATLERSRDQDTAPLLLQDKRSGLTRAIDQGKGLIRRKTDPETEEGQGFLKSAFKTIVGVTTAGLAGFGLAGAGRRRAYLESDKVSERDKRGAEMGIAAEIPSALAGAAGGALAGAKLGGILGSIFPGIGNLVGAGAGAAIGSAAAFFLGPEAVEAIGPEIEDMLTNAKESISEFASGIKQGALDLKDGLSEFGSDIKQGAIDLKDKFFDKASEVGNNILDFGKGIGDSIGGFITGAGESIAEFTAPLRDKATEFYTNFFGPEAPWAKTLTEKIGEGTDFVKEGAAKLGKKLGIEELSFKGIDDALQNNFAEVGIPQKEIDLPLFGKFKIGPFFPFRPDAPDLTAEEIKAGEEERKRQIEEEVFREGFAKTEFVDGKLKITGKSESPLDKLTREKIEQGVDPKLAREAAIAERRAEVEESTDSARAIARNMTGKTVDKISAATKINTQGKTFMVNDDVIADVGTKTFRENMANIGGEDQGTTFGATQVLSTEGSSAGKTYDNLDIFGMFDDKTGKATLVVSTDSAEKSDDKAIEVPRSIYAMARKMANDNVPAVDIIDAVNKALKEEKLGFMERQGFFESDEDYNKRLAQIEDTFDVSETTENLRKGESAVLGEAAVKQLSIQGAGKAVEVGIDNTGLTGNADEVIARRKSDDGRDFTIFGDGSYTVADGSGTAKYDKDGKFIHKDTPNIGGLLVRTFADGSTETTMQTQSGDANITQKFVNGEAQKLGIQTGNVGLGVGKDGSANLDFKISDSTNISAGTSGISTTGGLGADMGIMGEAIKNIASAGSSLFKSLFSSEPSGVKIEDMNMSQSQIEGIQRISAESLKDTPGAPTQQAPTSIVNSTDASTSVVNNNNIVPGRLEPKSSDESFNRVNNGNYAYG